MHFSDNYFHSNYKVDRATSIMLFSSQCSRFMRIEKTNNPYKFKNKDRKYFNYESNLLEIIWFYDGIEASDFEGILYKLIRISDDNSWFRYNQNVFDLFKRYKKSLA